MPRPKLHPERRRDQMLNVPMTHDELERLSRVAAEQRTTMAEMVRALVAGAIANRERRKRRAI